MEASNIKRLFKTSECFIIPAYQRAYSWGHIQREQFIQDLRDASDAYYLGHFLFEKEEGKDVMYLIDGQQRLTTVVIFFSCLKHELEKRRDLNDSKVCKLLANQYYVMLSTSVLDLKQLNMTNLSLRKKSLIVKNHLQEQIA